MAPLTLVHGAPWAISWTLVVPGSPVPWQRTRTRDGRHFDSRENKLAKSEILRAWQDLHVEPFPRGALIDLDATFYFSRPKSHYGTGRNSDTLKTSAPAFKASRPDVDNCLKLIKDALNGYAWHDDAQIVTASVSKPYVDDGGGGPHSRIIAVRIG